MADENIRLVRATPHLKHAFLDMAREFCDCGDDRYADAIADFDAFLSRTTDASQGRGLGPGIVPSTMFWLVRGGATVLAVSNLRHRLTPQLEAFGGHIGYVVRPSERRKGYGTRLLALTLQAARARGIGRALVTCDDDNIGSARVIEKNGGVLAETGTNPNSGVPLRRYWIEL